MADEKEVIEIPKAEYETLVVKAQIYDLLVVRNAADQKIAQLEAQIRENNGKS